ncbi:MAG: hypothetical protein AAGJ86_09880 [Pseudomonadota bacterium]
MTNWLTVAHIAVLGYWLGAELVINALYRYVCFDEHLSFADRDRLMRFLMRVDQHVRYALVLQVTLGCLLAITYGWLPGGESAKLVVVSGGALWLAFVEWVHRATRYRDGLARIDRASRYLLIVVLLALAFGVLGGSWPIPNWLRWKLMAFAGVVACALGIRLALLTHFGAWHSNDDDDLSDEAMVIVRRTYRRATSILFVLWLFIAVIVFLSVVRPS